MKAKKKQPSPRRSDQNTTLTVSLPRWLKEEIAHLAKQDRRNVSNYVVSRIECLVQQRVEDQQKVSGMPDSD